MTRDWDSPRPPSGKANDGRTIRQKALDQAATMVYLNLVNKFTKLIANKSPESEELQNLITFIRLFELEYPVAKEKGQAIITSGRTAPVQNPSDNPPRIIL